MTSSEQPWKSLSDLPEFLQQKVALLYQTKGRIESLELQLEELRKQEMDLKEELAGHGVQNPPRQDLAPINQCPDEVLYLIFENNLHSWTTVFNKTLLLVCKRWRRIVMDHPRLWTRIRIGNPVHLFDRISVKSQLPYVNACIHRSKGLPLEISLNLYHFPTPREYITESVYLTIQKATNTKYPEAVMGREWDESSFYDSQCTQILDCIMGSNNEHKKRWKLLFITLPHEEDLAEMVWRRLAGSFPVMTWCQITDIPLNWKEDPELEEELQVVDMPAVRSLGLGGEAGGHTLVFSPKLFKISPTDVEDLELTVDESLSNIPPVSAFTNLHALKLEIPNCMRAIIMPDTPICLSLPHLTTLELRDECSLLEKLEFDFPSLNLLRLEAFTGGYGLPKLSPRHIWWGVEQPYKISSSMSEVNVHDILMLSGRLETIKVGKELKRRVLRVVARLKEEEKLESLLSVIVDDRRNNLNREETIKASNIRPDSLTSLLEGDSSDELFPIEGRRSDSDESMSSSVDRSDEEGQSIEREVSVLSNGSDSDEG